MKSAEQIKSAVKNIAKKMNLKPIVMWVLYVQKKHNGLQMRCRTLEKNINFRKVLLARKKKPLA